MKIIIHAWEEHHIDNIKKLCVRYDDKDIETFGLFFDHMPIVAKEFEGMEYMEATKKFNRVVYPHKRTFPK